jgi:hypothetical protein
LGELKVKESNSKGENGMVANYLSFFHYSKVRHGFPTHIHKGLVAHLPPPPFFFLLKAPYLEEKNFENHHI